MSRIRSIKPGFFTDADLSELPPLHRLFYVGLWCHQDREGRCEDKPRELGVKILPYDDIDPDEMLWDLHEAGFVLRYEVAGKRFVCTPTFPVHQRPHRDEKMSEIPGPEDVKAQLRKRDPSVPAQQREDPPITSAKTPEAVDGGGGGLLSLEAVAGRAQKPAQPPTRFKALQEFLVGDFAIVREEPYVWHGAKDSDALKALMAVASDAEIRARWRFGLAAIGWKQCNTIAQLRSKWTDITAPEPPARRLG